MSHELPDHLTRIDEVSTILLNMYSRWLQEGGFNYETNRFNSSHAEATRRALIQVTNQWLASLAKQGEKLVVASQHCCRYNEGTYHWREDHPWETTEVTVASGLFKFADDGSYYSSGCSFDECYDKVHCFLTK